MGFAVTRGGFEWVGPLRYNRFAVTQGGLECGGLRGHSGGLEVMGLVAVVSRLGV